MYESIADGCVGTEGASSTRPGEDSGSFVISGCLICDSKFDIYLIANCSGGIGGRDKMLATVVRELLAQIPTACHLLHTTQAQKLSIVLLAAQEGMEAVEA